MKYVCLEYPDERAWAELGIVQRQALVDDSREYEAKLRKQGHLIDAHTLPGAASAMTVRFESGAVTVSAGPVAEPDEAIARIVVVAARDLNHAIGLISQMPHLRPGGVVEIRPLPECF